MNGRTKVAAIALAAGLVLVGSACSSSEAAKKLTEKAIEKQSGGDVDINSKDGTVKYTDKDGNETEMNIDGEGASLPKGWPDDLAPPDSIKLVTSTTSTAGSKTSMTVLGETETSIDDLVPAIKQQVEDAGFKVTQDATGGVAGTGYAGLTAAKGEDALVVAIASDPTQAGKVTVTMTYSTPIR